MTDEWILPSEQLPKLGEKVFVTIDGEIETAHRTNDTRDKTICWVTEYASYITDDEERVEAWLPMPKPYRRR